MESLILLVWRMRQDIILQNTRVVANSIITSTATGENADSAYKELEQTWKDYLDCLFPYDRGALATQDQKAIAYLKQEVARGPLRIIPLQPLTKPRSKLTRQYARGATPQVQQRGSVRKGW